MTWVKLDDKFHRNSKQLRMSDAAFRAYVRCLSYAADLPRAQITGFLTMVELAAQGATAKVTSELTAPAMNAWEPVNGGILIHDFEDYLPKSSTDKVRAWREAKRQESTESTNTPSSNPPVTVTPAQGNGSKATAQPPGNGHSHARAHPEPEPEPVPDNPPVPPSGGLLSDQAIQVIGWWCTKRGWQAVPPSKQREVYRDAGALASLGLEDGELLRLLDEVHDAAAEKPYSLQYFWVAAQERFHELVKVQKPPRSLSELVQMRSLDSKAPVTVTQPPPQPTGHESPQERA